MVQSSSKAWLISLLGLVLISKAICSDKPRSPPQVYVIWEQKNKTIYVGQDVELFCTILTKDENTKYGWYYSDADFPNEQNLGVLIDPHLYKQPPYNGHSTRLAHVRFTLKLPNLTIDQSGHYRCQAENVVGNDSRVTNLTVTYRSIIPVTTGAAPTFSDPNMLRRAFRAWPKSHNTRLKCKAIGAPPLKYIWLKDGERMQTRRLDPHLNSSLWYLKLKYLRTEDSGKYTCIVSNPYGSINHTYTLKVVAKARSKPILQNGLPRNTTVEIGGNAMMKCIVLVSGTLPDLRWVKWNKSITSVPYPKNNENLGKGSNQLIDPHYYKTIQVGEHYGVELRITDVTEDDFGLYTCVVSNHIGMDYSSAFLRRHVKPSRPLASDKVLEDRNTSQAQGKNSSTSAVTEREKTSWTSRIQYPWVLIGVSVAVIFALIIVSVWFCWKLKKVRTYAGRPLPGIASLQPKYDVHNEYVVVPDFK